MSKDESRSVNLKVPSINLNVPIPGERAQSLIRTVAAVVTAICGLEAPP